MKIGVTGFFNSFTFDNEGNMYLVSIGKFQELRKISLDNTTDVLSGFEGVLKIEKGNQFPEFGNWTDTNLAVDNNRKILYMSTSENKIFKLKLKG